MTEVLGYIEKTFDKAFLIENELKASEIVGGTAQTHFAFLSEDEKTLEPCDDGDFIKDMIHDNIGTIVTYDEVKEEAIIAFAHPIPLSIFKEYYADKDPVFLKTW